MVMRLVVCLSFCFLSSCAGMREYLQNNQVGYNPILELPFGENFVRKYKVLYEWKTWVKVSDERDFLFEKQKLKQKLQRGLKGYLPPPKNMEEDDIVLQEAKIPFLWGNSKEVDYNVLYIKWLEPKPEVKK